MLDTTVARWLITEDGDVIEHIADQPSCIWHTGNEMLAQALIAERREMVKSVYLRHLIHD